MTYIYHMASNHDIILIFGCCERQAYINTNCVVIAPIRGHVGINAGWRWWINN